MCRVVSLLPSKPHICLDGHSIERVNSYKCLGVQVDETLSWEAHISEVIGKVAKILAALRRLRPICHQSISSQEFTSHWFFRISIIAVLSGAVSAMASATN